MLSRPEAPPFSEHDILLDVFTEMLVRSERGGPHATGVAVLRDDGAHRIAERPMPARRFIGHSAFFEALAGVDNHATATIGHNRWRTRGSEQNNRNNHPIRAGQVIGTHNGTIYTMACEANGEQAATPAPEIPEDAILAAGTGDSLADAETQAHIAVRDLVMPEATDGRNTVHGELITFVDPARDLPPLDRLEGFVASGGRCRPSGQPVSLRSAHPDGHGLYRRALVAVMANTGIEGAWVYRMRRTCTGQRLRGHGGHLRGRLRVLEQGVRWVSRASEGTGSGLPHWERQAAIHLLYH